ncbi:hypothetical protein SPAN111604_02390 [Sphingomonas antarctica]|uniref:hypothetical protein n=1 Tax=Sphingomonas antarctica TaxID=2040274 RepID=UPI0039E819D4
MILLAAAASLLAVKGGWATFRDGPVCRAVAEPVRRTTTPLKPFAALAVAPGRAPVLSFRLGHVPRDGRAMLTVGGKSVQLAIAGDMARTIDPQAIDALRAGQTMTVRTRAGYEIYDLRGAPTAIDAALAACR